MAEREIIRTMRDVVDVDESDEKLEIVHTHYPIAPYSNHVIMEIVFYKKDRVIRVFRVNHDWGGAGSRGIVYVELREAEFQRLLTVARNVKDVGDFVDLINEIRKLEEEIDGEVEGKLIEVVDALKQLQISVDLRSLLDDRDRVLEVLWQYVE